MTTRDPKVKFVTPIRLDPNISKTAGGRETRFKGPQIGNGLCGIDLSRDPERSNP